MNKKLSIFIILSLLALIGIGIYFYKKNTSSQKLNETNYEANKTSTESNTFQNESTDNQKNTSANHENDSTSDNHTLASENNTDVNRSNNTVEEQLSAFSTKIYSNDANRTKNMEITTSTLNGTIVKKGETFSFCKTIGPATSSKGYLEADIYDHDGNKKKGYGGGNCQVSSTLYNAVLSIPNLTVVERHPHSNHVPYVPNGKDAAVAYGSYDFQFKNETGNDIKILSSVTEGLVNVTLIRLKTE